jgi:hypothetical protein
MPDGELKDAGLNPLIVSTDAIPCAFTSTIRLLLVSAMYTLPAGSTAMAAGELRVILPPVLIGRTSPENVKLVDAWATPLWVMNQRA